MSNLSADQYVKRGEKIVSGLYILKPKPWEEAAEAFKTAANLYACDEFYEQSIKFYIHAANCYQKCNYACEVASCYESAGKYYIECYRKNPDAKWVEFIDSTHQKAVKSYIDNNQNHRAASIHIKLAEFYKEIKQFNRALISYNLAIKYYNATEWVTTKMNCYERIAEIYIYDKDFDNASNSYQQLIEYHIKLNNLIGKYSQIKYITNQILCALASSDTVKAKRLMAQYETESLYFSTSNESEFLSKLIESLETWNLGQFLNIKVSYSYFIQDTRAQIFAHLESPLYHEEDFDLL